MGDWIMFWRNGCTVVDVVLSYGKDEKYPREGFAITPHFGRIDRNSIIETRAARDAAGAGGGA